MEEKNSNKQELVHNLIDMLNAVPYRDKMKLDEFRWQADLALRSIFGELSEYRIDLKAVRFGPLSFYSTANEYQDYWNKGIETTLKILNAVLNDPKLMNAPEEQEELKESPQPDDDLDPLEELALDELVTILTRDILKNDPKIVDKKPLEPLNLPLQSGSKIEEQKNPAREIIDQKIEEFHNSLQEVTKFSDRMERMDAAFGIPRAISNQIFIVHGNEITMLNAVVATLKRLGHESLISHDRSLEDKSIFQKFIDHPGIGFAVVLLSADDIGYRKDQTPNEARLRARQNVVFELGFLMGKLGRERVFVLYVEQRNFELPTSYFEAIYTPYDRFGHWQFELVRRLKSCDYKVDANQLLDQ